MAGVGARLAVGTAFVALLLSASSAAAPQPAAALYAGPGFDTCSAPSTATMQAWLASPYRAIGIYLGGINRACPDGNLSASWTASVVAQGWNLLPLYVGLQAPCVSQAGLALINPSTAAADGSAAADDAVARANVFGLVQGSPIYFDMEGYKTNSPDCTLAVQTFLGGWVSRLKSLGYLAGVYGSAASTIRDLLPSHGTPTGPDAVWIANWNGKQAVFGDPYVADTYWPNHQRIHQYQGGHNEIYAGIRLNIDGNAVDGPVVGPGGTVGPVPPPPPPPPVQAGSTTSSDGQATITWPANALPAGTTLTATPSSLPAEVNGFAAGSYVLQIGPPGTKLAAPATVTFRVPPSGVVAAFSTDGTTWRPLAATVASDGSLSVSVSATGSVGLLRDVAPPTSPRALTGRLTRGRLQLGWKAATDNSGTVASYEILRNGVPLAIATTTSAAVRGFSTGGPSVFRVRAVDAASQTSAPSPPVVVCPAKRPASIPKAIPNWAFQLAAWQQAGRAGKRPVAPKRPPAWYWTWQAWRLRPFRVV